MSARDFLPLIEIMRGGIVESLHSGAIAIVDSTGELLASYGNPDAICFMRSSAKPFQVLPMVEMDGMEHFHFTEQELALMCASHAGTEKHVAIAENILKKLDIEESSLLCGTHIPFDRQTAEALRNQGKNPRILQHNCSGKHLGMIAQCKLSNHPIDNYTDPSHPVQLNILETFADLCNLRPSDVQMGIDGCSVPTYAVPLKNAAFAYAQLSDPGRLSIKRRAACKRIFNAMTSHPDMISGDGRFDTMIMQTAGDTLLCKSGSEAFHAMGLVTDALSEGSPAMGIAFKVADGDPVERARPQIGLEILRQLGAITPEQLDKLSDFDFQKIVNQRGIEVGESCPYFMLDLNY